MEAVLLSSFSPPLSLSLSVSLRRTKVAFGDRIIPHCRADEKVAIVGDGIHYVISFRAIDKIEGAALFRAATIGALGPRRRDCRCAMSEEEEEEEEEDGRAGGGGGRTRERSRPSRRGPAWDQ